MVKINLTVASIEYIDNGTFINCHLEYKLVLPLWKIIWHYFRKLMMYISYPAISLASINTNFRKLLYKFTEMCKNIYCNTICNS